MQGSAAWGGGKASVPSPFAAIVWGGKFPTSFIFPPRSNRGSDCPGQRPMRGRPGLRALRTPPLGRRSAG